MGNCTSVNTCPDSPVFYLQAGQTEKVKRFLVKNTEYVKFSKPVNDFGDTLLHYAASIGNLEIVRWLIEEGIDLHATNEENWTALDSAMFAQNAEVVEILKNLRVESNFFK